MKRAAVIAILFFAFCGLADSAYVLQHEADGTPLLCNINALGGCNIVAQSPYSKFLGVPLAEYGVIFYGMIFALAALELAVFDRLLRRVLQGFALFGIAASLYFTFVQVFIIKALCVYCLGSAVVALLILAAASLIEPNFLGRRSASVRSPLEMPPSA
jgi:uncharacterized membrane protein